MESTERQIEIIVSSLEANDVSASLWEETIALVNTHPEAVCDFTNAIMKRYPKGGTFLDAAFSFLPYELWPELAERAIATLEEGNGENDAAASVIAYASLQCPKSLHKHLSRIFDSRPNADCYYEQFPWRESGELHFDFLRNIVENSAIADERRRAWESMLQTREPKIIDFVLSHAEAMYTKDQGLSHDRLAASLHFVGFDWLSHTHKNLCLDNLYHLQFPDAYFDENARSAWLSQIHPTWNLPAVTQSVFFGGSSDSECKRCRGKVHRLLDLDPIPSRIGISELPRLELAVCLSCLGWEEHQLFYQHDQRGHPEHAFFDGASAEPQFQVGPLKEAPVVLAESPRQWYWQDWALSNSRENLNRIGGEPCWIQDAEYPNCPSCNRTMGYLMQLDSDLPTADGEEWLWGSGGIGYCFWCNDCHVSGFLWQCT